MRKWRDFGSRWGLSLSCYDREAEQVKVILEHDATWQLPKTNLGQAESGTEAILRLTEQVTGQVLDADHVEHAAER